MAMVSIHLPEDVVDDLKRIAPQIGFTEYQSLMRAYIGQGLRADFERATDLVDRERMRELVSKLRSGADVTTRPAQQEADEPTETP